MCPICIATATWVALGAGASGGLATLVTLTWRRHRPKTPERNEGKRSQGR
jgi:hypothetical protein